LANINTKKYDKVIEKLLTLDLSKLDYRLISENIDKLYENFNNESVQEFFSATLAKSK